MTPQSAKLPVSVLIMTQNEEANIKFTLESVIPYFDQVIVTDSFSTDSTFTLLKQNPGVETYQHKFESWAEQRNWMLSNCAIRNEIVFFLDADEYVDERLVTELQNVLQNGVRFSAIYLDREYVFLGSTLKYAHGHPLTFRIFKKQGLSFIGEGAREYAKIAGPAIKLKSPYIHHDHNMLSTWLGKHNNNSDREAELFITRRKSGDTLPAENLSGTQRVKLWIRINLWDRLPLLSRPFLYFPFRYISTLGFMEGVPAFVYVYLNTFLYPSLIDAKILWLNAQVENKGPEVKNPVLHTKKLPVTVLIMTQNEEENIAYTIETVLPYFNQVIVVDSFSTDRTVEILKKYAEIEVYQHLFESWAEQRNWMLIHCPIHNEKVFVLDADEHITIDFVNELRQILDSGVSFTSIIIKPSFIFMGRHLRYAYGHPKVKRIFSHKVRFFGMGAREYAIIEGTCLEMTAPIIHCDHKPLSSWVAKHNNNSDREAICYIDRKTKDGRIKKANLPANLSTTLWIRRYIWNNLPLPFRAPGYFMYRYFVKFGFMDGIPGLVYCLLHAFLYQSMIDVKIVERLRNSNATNQDC